MLYVALLVELLIKFSYTHIEHRDILMLIFTVYSLGGDVQSSERRVQNHHRVEARADLSGDAGGQRQRSRLEEVVRGSSRKCFERGCSSRE